MYYIPKNVKYVIVRKIAGFDKMKSDFISQLAHEFKGMKEAVGYTNLTNALHYDTLEDAKEVLRSQPEWVKKEHEIMPFEYATHDCFVIVGAERYTV